MKALAALCGLMLGVSGAAASEQQVSLDWLKVVAFAAHQTEYSGVFVYEHDNRVETSRITHVIEADGEYEKLERLDGPKYDIFRHHGQVWCATGDRVIRMDNSQVRSRFPALLPEQLSALSGNYHASEAGTERVAGYGTQAILFRPKDNLRYAHKIWAHTDSGLLLKSAVLDDRSRVVEQYAFTQLQIGGDIDRAWIAAEAEKLSRASGPAFGMNGEALAVNSGWTVDALPSGFKKTMEIRRPMRGKHAPVTQIVFSDGLSAISLFIESSEGAATEKDGLRSRGAVNVYRKTVGEHLFTAVGEVPPRTVMQVLDSLRHNGE